MPRFWVSWNQEGRVARPTKVPHPTEVQAWWNAGRGDGFVMVCAIIDAPSKADIPELLEGYWNPSKFNFIQEKGQHWRPNKDKFPWTDGDAD